MPPSDNPPPDAPSPAAHVEFVAAWNSERIPFDRWIRTVTTEYERTRPTKSPLSLNDAALESGATQAEIAAVLRLGSLDEDSLRLLSEVTLPMTTWLAIGEASPERIRAAVDALRLRSAGQRAMEVVSPALGLVDENAMYRRILALSGEALHAIAQRATRYEASTPKGRRLLYDMARRFRKGDRKLTPKQLTFLHGVLESLAGSGILNNRPGENDQFACDEVRAALAGVG